MGKVFGYILDFPSYFDEIPERKFGLNSRFSSFGFTSVITIHNLGVKFLILILEITAVFFIFIGFYWRKTSFIAYIYEILTDLVLFGYVLNLLLVTYLPLLIILFIGVAGLKWDGENLSKQILFNNVMTITLLLIHLLIPTVIMVNLYLNKDKIGVQRKLNFQFEIE